MNSDSYEPRQTVSLAQVELVFLASAIVIVISAYLESLTVGDDSTVHIPAVLAAVGYWTLSIRGLSLIVRGLASGRSEDGSAGNTRRHMFAGVLFKLSGLVLLGDFMLDITRSKAASFFLAMLGYSTLGLFGILLLHLYLNRPGGAAPGGDSSKTAE